jgi:hypothetical protein
MTKLATLRELARTRPVAVAVDDDDEVVAAMRSEGFPVLHARWMEELEATQHTALREAQEDEGRT